VKSYRVSNEASGKKRRSDTFRCHTGDEAFGRSISPLKIAPNPLRIGAALVLVRGRAIAAGVGGRRRGRLIIIPAGRTTATRRDCAAYSTGGATAGLAAVVIEVAAGGARTAAVRSRIHVRIRVAGTGAVVGIVLVK